MKKEKSCGAVIYRIKNNKVYYLLSRMGYGHVSLSKGHVEKNETEVETAQREIFEETSLHPIIDTNFRKVITYSPAVGVSKDVVFFVAKDMSTDEPIDTHDDEVTGFYLLEYDEAYAKLSHDGDKEVLIEANDYIEGKEHGKL